MTSTALDEQAVQNRTFSSLNTLFWTSVWLLWMTCSKHIQMTVDAAREKEWMTGTSDLKIDTTNMLGLRQCLFATEVLEVARKRKMHHQSITPQTQEQARAKDPPETETVTWSLPQRPMVEDKHNHLQLWRTFGTKDPSKQKVKKLWQHCFDKWRKWTLINATPVTPTTQRKMSIEKQSKRSMRCRTSEEPTMRDDGAAERVDKDGTRLLVAAHTKTMDEHCSRSMHPCNPELRNTLISVENLNVENNLGHDRWNSEKALSFCHHD